MKPVRLLALILCFAFFVPASAAPILLERGEEGFLRTTLSGVEVQELPVRYIGVSRNGVGPGVDLHLVELLGPMGESAGIWSGMSGSPVYFRGELTGALAYRLGQMPKKAIGGFVSLDAIRKAARISSGAEPIATPVAVSGASPEVLEWLQDVLRDERLSIVSGVDGSASALDAEGTAPLQPGSPVGVSLVHGDLNIAATGTVTFLEGEQVYAFGHSFLGMGKVELPMLSASVLHVLEDTAGSVRLTNTGAEIGVVLDDRSTAVVGRLGVAARVIPLTVRIHEPDGKTETLRFQVARHHRLAPAMIGAAVANAVMARARYETEVTVLGSGRIELADGSRVPLDMAFTSAGFALGILGVAGELQQKTGALYRSGFADPEISAVEVDLDVAWEVRTWELRNLLYDRGPVEPGETIEVGCYLVGPGKQTKIEQLAIIVPDNLASGTRVTLAVGTPAMINKALGSPDQAALAAAADLDSFVQALGRPRSPHRLTAILFRAGEGAVVEGRVLEELPPSALQWIKARRGATARSSRKTVLLEKIETELDGPLTGGLMIRLEVR
jgi:hypothetical protein